MFYLENYLFYIFTIFNKYVVAETLNQRIFESGDSDFVDLTHSFVSDINTKSYLLRESVWLDSESDTCMNERYATRVDVRFIFSTQGYYADSIPPKRLILPLIIADVSDQVNGNGDYILYKNRLDYMLNNYFNRVQQPCLVVFKFGWSQYYNTNPEKYFANGNYTYPGISEEVATWITRSYKNVVGVGVDTPSLDPSSVTLFPATEIFFKAGLYVLTNVKLDQDVPDSQCLALVSPVKVLRGLGAPVRLMAICPNSSKLPETTTKKGIWRRFISIFE